MPNKPILFWDFDGVIFDSGAAVYQMWHKVFEHKGVSFTHEQFQTIFEGNSWAKFQEYGATESDQEFYSQLENQRFNPETPKDEFPIFPFMADVARELSKTYWNYIISNNQNRVIKAFLAHHELEDVFQHISGRDDWRPKTEKTIECMSEVDQDPSTSWFLTDSVGDVLEAKHAGMQSLAVTWGYQDFQRLQNSSPTKIVFQPKEILAVLGNTGV